MHVAAVEPFKEIDHETTYISQDLREISNWDGLDPRKYHDWGMHISKVSKPQMENA